MVTSTPYRRNCSCGRTLFYSDKYKLANSIKSESKCRICVGKARKGKKYSNETCRKISEALRGHSCYKNRVGIPCSEETKRKISKTVSGRKLPKSWSEKIRLKNKGRKMTDEQILRCMAGRDKSTYKRKPYMLGSQKVMTQGYESWTLEKLVLEQIPISEIKVNTVDKPRVKYFWDGKERWYYPDCYITSTNTIVETKSNWTWESDLQKNLAKIEACNKVGYKVRVVAWTSTKEIHLDKIYG